MYTSIYEQFPGIQFFDDMSNIVTNPLNGNECKLPPTALAVYDYLKGAEINDDLEGMRNGMLWFIEEHPIEYLSTIRDFKIEQVIKLEIFDEKTSKNSKARTRSRHS